MSNYEGIKYNFDGSGLSGIEGVPTGTIVSWSKSAVPTGFLECDGSNVSRSTYSDLFSAIGTTYGAGDGSSTFGLPDLQDNVAVGKSGTKALASTGGANTVTPTGNVAGSTANATLSTSQLSSHNHLIVGQPFGGASNSRLEGAMGGGTYTGNRGDGGGHSHNMSANFVGTANSVVQPYLALLYIIKT
tara:strand:- start:1066 stop:1629 length:564 start_codon:yes stop_codon:yes gene_type:complete